MMVRGIDRMAPWEPDGAAREPLVIVANHSSWWDAVMPVIISRSIRHHDGYGLMDRGQFERYRFFRHVDILPIDRGNPRAAMRSLHEIAELLRDRKRMVWMFPQGKIAPNDIRPLVCESGVAHLVGMLGACSVIPVAFRYEVGRDELPVAYAGIGEARSFRDAPPARELTALIGGMLTGELDRLRDDLLAERTDGFQVALQGSGSVNDRWDRARGLE